MGTELLSRGHSLPLPLWSADYNLTAPDDVLAIHRAYGEAGVDIFTTNTFRTTPRTYFTAGYTYRQARLRARESLLRAVALARKVAGEKLVWGSITALEDCYRPELSPGKTIALEEFAELVDWFRETEVDGILFETLGQAGEIEAALETDLGSLPRYLSLIVKDETHLLDGTELAGWIPNIPEGLVDALLINCSHYQATLNALAEISVRRKEPLGAYPNLGKTQPSPAGRIEKRITNEEWATFLDTALRQGLTILGACCGSTPGHIRIIREQVERWINQGIKSTQERRRT